MRGCLISSGISALFSRPPPSNIGSSLKMLLLLSSSGLPEDSATNSKGNLSHWQKAVMAVSVASKSSSETL